MFIGGVILMLGGQILLLHPKHNIRIRLGHGGMSRSNKEGVIFVTECKGGEVTSKGHVLESFIT